MPRTPAGYSLLARRAFFFSALAPLLFAQDPFASLRDRMIRSDLEARGIRHPAVLRAMRATPRHLFVPADLRDAAYEDRPLPIGYDATISQPYIVALMMELLEPGRSHRVLEIGTGSGYQAAILAQLTSHVYTIEIVPQLAAAAAETLRRQGHTNVTVRAGDGYRGWPEQAPFDRIILTAAPPAVPQTLLDQLAPGGRLVAPIGPQFEQHLTLIEKTRTGTLRRTVIAPVSFVRMK